VVEMARKKFDMHKKKDHIGKGRLDTKMPGWGKRLSDGILLDIRDLGIGGGNLPLINITDNGEVEVEFTSLEGRQKKLFSTYDPSISGIRTSIVRNRYEITDNLLREWLNGILDKIWKYQESMGNIDSSSQDRMDSGRNPPLMDICSIFHETMTIGENKWQTCAILNKMRKDAAECSPEFYGKDKYDIYNISDCRRCVVPALFNEEAKEIIRARMQKLP
jgi:hypothetical protein